MSAGVTCNTLLRRRKSSLVIQQAAGSLMRLTVNLSLGVRAARKQPWKRGLQLSRLLCVMATLTVCRCEKGKFQKEKKKNIVNRVLKERWCKRSGKI